MSDSSTFGDTVTGGIQDISALLPLLGTEQCEEHVGSALDRGFLCSLVTSISIFGSLGIVRASLTILLASFNTWRFHFVGARALRDSGFGLPGTVAPLIGIDREHPKRFLAETKLEEMLAEQHIGNVSDLNVLVGKRGVRWNIKLVFSTLFVSLAGLLPYITIIVDLGTANPKQFFPLGFGFPILRVFGSAVCVIVAQILIQIRIMTLVKTRLVFICIDRLAKATDIDLASEIAATAKRKQGRQDQVAIAAWARDPTAETNETWTPELAAEGCIYALQQCVLFLKQEHERQEQEEEQRRHKEEQERPLRQKIIHTFDSQVESHFGPTGTLLHPSIIFLLCFILAVGCVSTVVGYVGCFFLIQNSASSAGTFVWLGVEAVLSVLRIIVWAANPSWNDPFGIIFQLRLSTKAPMITCDKYTDDIVLKHIEAPLMPSNTFLEEITAYTGPLPAFNVPGVELYYILAPRKRPDRTPARHLIIIISPLNHLPPRMIIKDNSTGRFDIYICSLHHLLGTPVINVRAETKTKYGSHLLTADADFMRLFERHYNEICDRISSGDIAPSQQLQHMAISRRTWAMRQLGQVWRTTGDQALRISWGFERSNILSKCEDAYISYHQVGQRKRELHQLFDEWIENQVRKYTPASFPDDMPASQETVHKSDYPVILYLKQCDVFEKELLRLECRRILEYHLLSYAAGWDDKVKQAHRGTINQLISEYERSAHVNSADQDSRTRLEKRLHKELDFFFEHEAATQRNNKWARIIDAHGSDLYLGGSSAPWVGQSDPHPEQFLKVMEKFIEPENNPDGHRLDINQERKNFDVAIRDRFVKFGEKELSRGPISLNNSSRRLSQQSTSKTYEAQEFRETLMHSAHSITMAEWCKSRAVTLFKMLEAIDVHLLVDNFQRGLHSTELDLEYTDKFQRMLTNVANEWEQLLKSAEKGEL